MSSVPVHMSKVMKAVLIHQAGECLCHVKLWAG